VNKLAADLHRVIRSPETQPRWSSIGVTPLGGTVEEAAKRNAVETERWSKVIRVAGIRVD
jgi:tripartite-type tricarboxylate transporter receptor subunit TctC